MTNQKAILCIDIDGTLINEQGQVHPCDIEILQDFPQTIQPILTTGRNIHSVKKILRQNGLQKNNHLSMPGVFMNGGLTLLPSEDLCTTHVFTTKALAELIRLAKENKEKPFTFYSLEEVLLVNPNNFAREKLNVLFEEAQDCGPDDIPDEIFKIIIFSEDPHDLDPIKPGVKPLSLEIVFSLPFAYEINPPGISKGTSLIDLTKALRMAHLPIYAVGDADNDLSLFSLATKRFASASAQSAVLNQADFIIQRDQNGLFSTILKHIDYG